MPEAKNQIQFEELGLGSLLKRYQLRVPPNQREYSWTDREVTQLLQDFGRAVNDAGPYFLGTVVTIPRNGAGTLEVVDGQQRLATTTLLLAAIRDHLITRDEDMLVQSINSEFLSGIDRDRKERVPKLTLNLDDNELFKRIVTSEPSGPLPKATRASHERLLLAHREAQKQVRNIVSLVGEREHGDQLNRWVSFIEHRALVVLLRVPGDADAYRMFETLNDRGLRTSQADLIKNFLFSRSGDRFPEVQNRWSYMRGALESGSDDPDTTINFLRLALILQKGHVLGAEVYERVQELVKSEPAAVSFAVNLETLANVYVATFSSVHEKWNVYPAAARRALDVLNQFEIKPMRPLILAIGTKLDPKEATLVFTFLIALSVRLMIASNTRSASVEIPLANAARDVFQGPLDSRAKLQAALASITPTDREFQVEFERARVSNAKLARYYLRSMEMTAKGEAEPWFLPQDDQQVINLEHVLPKRPEEHWPQFKEDEVNLYATRLGNQVLMRASDNSTLKSQGYSEKKPVYAASPYILTSQVADADEWTTATIERRQSGLAELAVRTWSIKR